MARRGMTGQLNMFDFFKGLDDVGAGEVQMVSLMPSEEPEEEPVAEREPEPDRKPEAEREPEPDRKPEVEPKPAPVKRERKKSVLPADSNGERPVMCRQYEIDGEQIEIAYLNYNKVRIVIGGEAPIIEEFASSKEAVDYYVEKMQELEPEE